MSEKKAYDESYYFSYFKKLFESWEESTHKAMDIWLKSPFMDRAFDKSTEFKQYVQKFMENSLESRATPDTQSIEKLIESINQIEQKVSRIEKKVDELGTKQQRTTSKRRTTKTKK